MISPEGTTTSQAETGTRNSVADGALTREFLDSLREDYRMAVSDRACHNAVTNNEIDALALNREALRGSDEYFSHRIKTKGITHQRKSGRCWLFAALNTLRPEVIREHDMAEFEFSAAYLHFWDRIERANIYLESVIELRESDFLDRDWEAVNRWVLDDGGWWNYAVGLIEKYGAVPQSVMPETHGSSNTKTLNEIFGRLVRSRAAGILERHEGGAGVKELRGMKDDALKEVYRFLVINFGEPPKEFDWRFKRAVKDDEGSSAAVEVDDLSPFEHFTPRSFAEKFIGRTLGEFVCLYNDPKNELDRHYSFHRACNIVGNRCMNFVNIDMAPMKKIAVASILANEPLWFAVYMHFDQSRELGVMQDRLFDYEALFGIDLSLNKADRARFHAAVSNHAMALMGVDLDSDGCPKKWLVENSWGKDEGDKGSWTLHDPWFDEHVYTIITHRRHVPDEILMVFEKEAEELPSWYPGALGVG